MKSLKYHCLAQNKNMVSNVTNTVTLVVYYTPDFSPFIRGFLYMGVGDIFIRHLIRIMYNMLIQAKGAHF